MKTDKNVPVNFFKFYCANKNYFIYHSYDYSTSTILEIVSTFGRQSFEKYRKNNNRMCVCLIENHWHFYSFLEFKKVFLFLNCSYEAKM